MTEYLPYDEIKFIGGASVSQSDRDKNVSIEDILNTPDDSDIGYFVEIDIKDSDNIKDKTRNFFFCPENQIGRQDKNSNHIRDIKPYIYTQKKEVNM